MSDFYSLDQHAQAERMRALAETALAHWDIDASQFDLIKYRENAVFCATTTDGARYAVRIHRAGYHSDDELRSELQWIDALSDYGIEVPAIVPCRDASSFAVVTGEGIPEPRQVDIFHWVEGRQLGSAEAGVADIQSIGQTYHTIGTLAAQLHNQATTWVLPEGFTRHAWDAAGLVGPTPFWGPFWELAALTDEQRQLLIAARDRVYVDMEAYAADPGNADRYSLIHADFVAENLMVDGDVVRLIDFDDAGFGWHLFELATALYFEMEADYYQDAYTALVQGYREYRSLPDSQLDYLPLFLLARSFTYLGWVHTRFETETARQMTPMLVEKACNVAQAYLAG
ncbi:MAG: phosphotransferase [Gammaproteobacteria bacterium]|nr:phosphotransferase [Gammaproteobacteria bacterium]MDH5172338.1 phosphotransferase [Gammaproteobacteria bacterium]